MKSYMIKHKRMITVVLVLVTVVFIGLFSPLKSSTKTKNDKEEALTPQATQLMRGAKDNSNVAYADSVNPSSQVWTLYAQLVMGNGDVEEGAAGTGQMKLFGQGGVSADFPYSDITKDGNDMTGSKAGTQLASFLATYNYYGYIDTVAGNSIATGASSFLDGVMKLVGSLLAGIAQTMSGVAEQLNNLVGNFVLSLDFISFLGFGDPAEGNSNPITKAISTFLDALGLNSTIFRALMKFMMILLSGVFIFQIMRGLTWEGFRSSRARRAFKRIILMVVMYALFFPVCQALLHSIISDVKAENAEGNLNGDTVSAYIINTKLWAITQNLAPDSTLGAGQVPNANSKSPMKWIDSDYEPSQKKDMITMINSLSYAAQNGDLNSAAIGMALIKEWSTNATFNVNDYAGGVNVAKNDIYMRGIPALGANSSHPDDSEKNVVLAKPDKLPNYIWSADQNVEDGNRNPTGEGSEEDSKDNGKVKFDPTAKWGVQNNGTFSTQSVALMLQSDIDANGTKLYAYNLQPSGVQGMAKNMSTVKTTWRTASLVGHGAMGKFGSFLAMISESVVIMFLYFGCAWALLKANIFEAFKKFIIRTGEMIVLVSEAAAAGIMAITIGMIFTGAIGLKLPQLLIQLSRDFSTTITGFVPSDLMMDGVANLLHGLIVLGMGYLFIFVKTKDGISIVELIVNIPLELAMAFDKQAKRMIGYNNGLARAASGMPGIDNYSGSNYGDMGATNPYFNPNFDRGDYGVGSTKDAIAKGLGYVGAKSLADKLDGLGSSEEVSKRANDIVNRGTMNNRGSNRAPGLSTRDMMLARNQTMDEMETDHLGRLYNADGKMVDTEGNVLEDGYGMNSSGQLIDDVGRLVDEDGNLVNELGEQLGDDEYGMNSEGLLIDEEGRLVDEDGNLVDRSGNLIEDYEYGMSADGHRLDDAGRLVDEEGNLLDASGNIIDPDYGYGIDMSGNLIDDSHRMVNDDGELIDLDGNVIEDGFGMDVHGNYRNREGLKVDKNGELLEQSRSKYHHSDSDYEDDREQSSREILAQKERGESGSGVRVNKGKLIEDNEEDEGAMKTTRRELREEKEQKTRAAKAEVKKEISKEAMKNIAQRTKNGSVKGLVKASDEMRKAPAGSIAGVTYKAATKTTKVVKKGYEVAKKTTDKNTRKNPIKDYQDRVKRKLEEDQENE